MKANKPSTEPTVYQRRITAMELAIKSQRGAPHHATLIKVANEIYKWLNDVNYENKTD